METIQAELRKSMHYLSMKKRDHAADKIDALQAQVEALTAELSKQEKPVRPMSDDLAALVSRLARALGKANPSHDLPVKAMRYLADNDLLNGPWLRSKEYGATDEDIATFVAHIKGATE